MSLDEFDVPITLEVSNLKKKLRNTESPFTWLIDIKENIDPNNLIKSYLRKVNTYEIEDDEENFQIYLFLFHLLLCYEYTRIKNLEEATNHLDLSEQILTSFDDEHFLWPCQDAIEHILNSTKAYLYLHKNCINETTETLNKIISKNELNKQNQGCLLALKARCISFDSKQYLNKCLEYIKEAQILDPFQMHWVYSEGSILRKIRKIYNPHSIPDDREIEALRKAYTHDCNITHLGEFSSSLVAKARKVCFPQKMFLFREVEAIMKKLVEKYPDSMRALLMVATCFIRLPFIDCVLLGKNYLEKILANRPDSSTANDHLGYYYDFKAHDYAKAAFYYEKAAINDCFHAWIRNFSCKYKQNKNYKPNDDLNDLLKRTSVPYEQALCFQELGWWIFIEERDIKKAIYTWANILELDLYSFIINLSSPKIIRLTDNYKISEIMFDEIQKYLQNGNIDSGSELSFFEKTKKTLILLDPTFSERIPKSWMQDIQISVWKAKNQNFKTKQNQNNHWSLKGTNEPLSWRKRSS